MRQNRLILFLSAAIAAFLFSEGRLGAEERDVVLVMVENGGAVRESERITVNRMAKLSLSYIHSIHRTLQEEYYTIREGLLVLEEMRFGNLEAVDYYDPNPGGKLTLKNGFWSLELLPPQAFSRVRMRIPFTVPIRLAIDGVTAWVARKIDEGALLIVKVEKDAL